MTVQSPTMAPSPAASPPAPRPAASARIVSIDALRGFVILLMLVDHAREFFYLNAQVSDPMAVPGTDPALFLTRLAAHLCAPVFVALTGLAAWLYGRGRGGAAATSGFLFRRGLFLVALELTVISFAWTFAFPPPVLFLQVIWVIGLSMIALAALVHLPAGAILAIGVGIVAGHNLLDGIAFAPGEAGYAAWTILHDRGMLDLGFVRARTSYPLLPWIGIIALGYAAGPWFARDVAPAVRQRRLVWLGVGLLAAFAVLRAINGYGEPSPWAAQPSALLTVMSFVNLTKYPPSLDFALLTLGAGALLLAWFERLPARPVALLAVFGAAPLFFYILHLYALHLLSLGAAAVTGAGDDHGLTMLPNVAAVWAVAALVAVPCWFACRRFGAVKRASGRWWMRYL